jgi:PAS domain S-box-containing protein
LSAWPLSTVAAINEDAELMPLLRRQERERQRTGWAMALVLAFAVGVAALLVRVARKNVEATRSEARFRAIIEASPVPYALNDESQRILFVNSAFRRTFGYTVEDIPTLQAWWPKAYPDPDYRRWVTTRWQERLASARRDSSPFDRWSVRPRRDRPDRTAAAAASAMLHATTWMLTSPSAKRLKVGRSRELPAAGIRSILASPSTIADRLVTATMPT